MVAVQEQWDNENNVQYIGVNCRWVKWGPEIQRLMLDGGSPYNLHNFSLKGPGFVGEFILHAWLELLHHLIYVMLTFLYASDIKPFRMSSGFPPNLVMDNSTVSLWNNMEPTSIWGTVKSKEKIQWHACLYRPVHLLYPGKKLHVLESIKLMSHDTQTTLSQPMTIA
jgi:hypothetical protein